MATRQFEINAPTVIAEIVDGEVMVMNLRDGIYYSVTGSGAAAWTALTEGFPLDAIASAIASASATPRETVEPELQHFVERLLKEGILRERAQANDAGIVAALEPGAYRGFTFERFDDMRAMLILDPVHEVGGFGWPEKAEPAPGAKPEPGQR